MGEWSNWHDPQAAPYHYPAKWIPYPVQAMILIVIYGLVIVAGIRAIT